MCGVNDRLDGSKPPPNPAWSGLYVLAALMLGALFLAQTMLAASAERTFLQCGLVLSGFAAMVAWARRNRTALDHMDWCDCARSRTTVRVIPSRGAGPARAGGGRARRRVEPEPAELRTEEVAP
jgi:hypothetical protein